MSRDLKKEYEAMLDQEIPDLWSRIEPRLADKKGTQSARSINPVKAGSFETGDCPGIEKNVLPEQRAQQDAERNVWRQENTGSDAGQQDVQPNEKRSPRRHIRRSTIAVWGSLAAACVCLAVIFPAWMGSKKGADGTNQMFSADQNTIDMTAEDTTAADNTAASDGAMVSKNELQPESGMMNGSAESPSYADSADDADMAGTESAAEDIPVADDGAEWSDGIWADCESDTESAAATPEESGSEPETDQGAEEGAPLRYECDGEVIDDWRTEEGFFYQMKLIGGAAELMPDETEILIWQKIGLLSGISGAREKALTTGKYYTVVVEQEVVDGETRYVLISYEADDRD